MESKGLSLVVDFSVCFGLRFKFCGSVSPWGLESLSRTQLTITKFE